MANGRSHAVELFLPRFTQAGDRKVTLKLALQGRPVTADIMAVKTIDNFVVLWRIFRHHDRLCESIQLQ